LIPVGKYTFRQNQFRLDTKDKTTVRGYAKPFVKLWFFFFFSFATKEHR
jgi:hypothetical protein